MQNQITQATKKSNVNMGSSLIDIHETQTHYLVCLKISPKLGNHLEVSLDSGELMVSGNDDKLSAKNPSPRSLKINPTLNLLPHNIKNDS